MNDVRTVTAPAVTWIARRPSAVRVLLRTIGVGPQGGAVFGGVVWSILSVRTPTTTPSEWRGGMVFALPIGAIIGVALGIVAGAVLAVLHARRPHGWVGHEVREVAAVAAGVPVLVVSGVPGVANLTYFVGFAIPLSAATALVAAWVAPRLVAPVWTGRVQLNRSSAEAAEAAEAA